MPASSIRRALKFVVLAMLGLAGCATLALIYLEHRWDQREALARVLINENELEFQDMRLAFALGANTAALTGRVVNRSPEPLRSVTLSVSVSDCAEEHCLVVAQEEVTVYADAPPGQARDIDQAIYPRPAPRFRGTMQWDYDVVETVAALPAN